MAKLVNWEIFQKTLKNKGFSIFTPLDVRRVLGASKTAVTFLLYRYNKRGWLARLKPGLYFFSDAAPSNFLIANRLYHPSYISFDAAMAYYGIIPESIYAVTSATSKATRSFVKEGINYTYQKIKKNAFTGYRATQYRGETILIAEPEKALADYLYFIDLKKRGLHYERLDLTKINKTKLKTYCELFNRPGISQLIKKIYDEFGKPKRVY